MACTVVRNTAEESWKSKPNSELFSKVLLKPSYLKWIVLNSNGGWNLPITSQLCDDFNRRIRMVGCRGPLFPA